MIRMPVAVPRAIFGANAPDPLAVIIADLAEAGAQVTPLAIISRCTDIGMSDAELKGVIKKLAQAHDVEAAA